MQNAAAYPEGVFVSGLEPGAGTNVVVHLDSAMTEGDLQFKNHAGADVDGAVVIGSRLAEHLSALPGRRDLHVCPVGGARNRVTGTIDAAAPLGDGSDRHLQDRDVHLRQFSTS